MSFAARARAAAARKDLGAEGAMAALGRALDDDIEAVRLLRAGLRLQREAADACPMMAIRVED